MTHKKTRLVLGIATAIFALTGAVASTEALAKKQKKYKKHKVSSVAPKVNPLQAQLDALSAKVRELEARPATQTVAAPAADSASKSQLDALDSKVRDLETRKEGKNNMVFFRGGWARADAGRRGVSIKSTVVSSQNGAVNAAVGGDKADNDAWYMGAGLDFSIDDNLFGLMNNTEVLGEVMFEYKEFADKVKGNALTNTNQVVVGGVAGGLGLPSTLNANGNPSQVTVSQFTLTASPKIKFMKGSDFRPWIIPIGFGINVVSPPSESITVLEPEMMFGAGADYRLWKNIYVGVDGRYHYAVGTLDRVRTDGFTLGGYLGLGF
jgi:opacity protein-like surface antigen/outer membrane murein-binding lipoprotein Lpp